MISMKKLRFSSHPGGKVGCQWPLGSARAQLQLSIIACSGLPIQQTTIEPNQKRLNKGNTAGPSLRFEAAITNEDSPIPSCKTFK